MSQTRSSTARRRVMLSAETAVGEYPIEAVATMARIARAVEPSLGYRHQLPLRPRGPDRRASHVERRLRPRRGARREGDPGADVHGAHGVGRRAAPAASSGRRAHARRRVSSAHGDRVGRHAARDPRGDGRRGALEPAPSRLRAMRASSTPETASSSPRARRSTFPARPTSSRSTSPSSSIPGIKRTLSRRNDSGREADAFRGSRDLDPPLFGGSRSA